MRDLEKKIVELKDVKDQQLMKLKNFRPKKWVNYLLYDMCFYEVFFLIIIYVF